MIFNDLSIRSWSSCYCFQSLQDLKSETCSDVEACEGKRSAAMQHWASLAGVPSTSAMECRGASVPLKRNCNWVLGLSASVRSGHLEGNHMSKSSKTSKITLKSSWNHYTSHFLANLTVASNFKGKLPRKKSGRKKFPSAAVFVFLRSAWGWWLAVEMQCLNSQVAWIYDRCEQEI